MKKSFFVTLTILIQYTLCIAQTINIPDTNFKNKLITADVDLGHNYAKNLSGQFIKIDSNNDFQIQQSEALQVAYLTMNSSGIIDLTGLEFFINLTELYVGNNSLINLPISTLTQLSILLVSNCNLSSLNLTDLISLSILYCSGNHLQYIDLSGNPSLVKLICRNNNLTNINIKNGINHDFSVLGANDCWKIGNPSLTTICADASEVASVQSFLDGCGSAQTINITSNCGLNNQEFSNDVTVYPNPFKDKLTIDTTQLLDEYNSIEIYNALGSLVYNNSILIPINEIDLSYLPNGIYILRLLGDSKKTSVKLIKN